MPEANVHRSACFYGTWITLLQTNRIHATLTVSLKKFCKFMNIQKFSAAGIIANIQMLDE